MHAIQAAAFVSIGRGCGFAGLAVLCVMLGLSYEPAHAMHTGGAMTFLLTLYLAAGALRARTRPYKRTETWLILPKDERPPAVIAQRVIGEALREAYLWFAKHAAVISVLLLASAVALRSLA